MHSRSLASSRMAVPRALLMVMLCVLWTSCAGVPQATSVNQLRDYMYKDMKYSRACYKLLNSTGTIGCEDPTGLGAEATLIRYTDLPASLNVDRMVVVPAASLADLASKLQTEPSYKRHIKGILVDARQAPASDSSAPTFPGAAYSLYPPAGYAWNPSGNGLNRQWFGIPMYALTDALAAEAEERAAYNQANSFSGTLYQAYMSLKMEAKLNSTNCLANGNCLPLGGHSVWAAMPPINPNETDSKPITLVVAQVDSNDVFHDLVQGADAPLSGLLAMLAAVHLLDQAQQWGFYSRRLVFLALVGEPWDYMGSRRLLWEIKNGSVTVAGLDPAKIDQVIEVGQVGRARAASTNSTQLYLHRAKGAAYGNPAPLDAALRSAAAATSEYSVAVANASSSTPGLPPSSLHVLLRWQPALQALYLGEFDQQYTNPYYESRFDTNSTLDQQAVAATAALLARTLHTLGMAGQGASSLAVNTTSLTSMVASLTECLAQNSPGLSCSLASQIMVAGYSSQDGVVSYAPQHYVGVVRLWAADPQDPSYKSDVSRFIWNFLAFTTSPNTSATQACDPIRNLCPRGQVCAGWKYGTSDPGLMGKCVTASVAYVPSISTRINCTNCQDPNNFRWQVTDAAASWEQQLGWPEDPLWAESNWPLNVPLLRLYQREAYSTEVAVLTAGLVLTAAAVVVSHISKRAFEKHLKSQ